jgi:hypothetical protein
MTSFFRKLRWLMRCPGKEAELEEELRFHLQEEAAERQAEGLPRRRGASGRPPRVGKPHSTQGGHARRVDLDVLGTAGAGHPLRTAHNRRQQDFQRHGDPVMSCGPWETR